MPRNPLTASRMAKVFSRWRSYGAERQSVMREAIEGWQPQICQRIQLRWWPCSGRNDHHDNGNADQQQEDSSLLRLCSPP